MTRQDYIDQMKTTYAAEAEAKVQAAVELLAKQSQNGADATGNNPISSASDPEGDEEGAKPTYDCYGQGLLNQLEAWDEGLTEDLEGFLDGTGDPATTSWVGSDWDEVHEELNCYSLRIQILKNKGLWRFVFFVDEKGEECYLLSNGSEYDQSLEERLKEMKESGEKVETMKGVH